MPCPNCGSEKVLWGRRPVLSIESQNASSIPTENIDFQQNLTFIIQEKEVAALAICEECGCFYNCMTKMKEKSIKINKKLKKNKLRFIANARKK